MEKVFWGGGVHKKKKKVQVTTFPREADALRKSFYIRGRENERRATLIHKIHTKARREQ